MERKVNLLAIVGQSYKCSMIINYNGCVLLIQFVCLYYDARIVYTMIESEHTHHWGKDHCTVSLQFNKTDSIKKRICCYLYQCSETVES